jgi:hypothetical protein
MVARRGRNASIAGRYSEDVVESMFPLIGFPIYSFATYDGSTPSVVRQYPAPHPYRPTEKRAGKNDFMIFTGVEKVYCQVKNQDGSGTCDEKLSFAFDIARYCLTDDRFDRFALILLGKWWPSHPGIIEWAQRKCTEFQMLAEGTRSRIKAEVIVGPKELSAWLQTLPTKASNKSLFQR